MPHNPSNSSEVVSRFVKKSDVTSDLARQQAWNHVRNLLLTGLGVGAAARGTMGLASMLSRNTSDPSPPRAGPVITPTPVPADMVEDEELNQHKLACAAMSLLEKKAEEPGFLSQMAGLSTQVPWVMPAAMLAAGGGLYGGWKAVDKLLDARRRAAQEAEYEEAKREFETAIMDQYGKQGADSELRRALDGLFEKASRFNDMVKSAFWPEVGNVALNSYGTYAGLTGLAAALWAYNQARQSNQSDVLRAAQSKRLAKRYAQRPPAIVAIPQPMRREEEENEEQSALPA